MYKPIGQSSGRAQNNFNPKAA